MLVDNIKKINISVHIAALFVTPFQSFLNKQNTKQHKYWFIVMFY